MNTPIEQTCALIRQANRIVAFSGAGISTEAAAMLFMKSERNAPAAITTKTSCRSELPEARTRKSATLVLTPVRYKPCAST